ncbi:hypothetical protein JR316_0008301 [Psilocybe cubensis]|uniref:Uncharacterized protein n=1 Tax=Psilocybe cubensis TaxID=181762 RepID=A0ACB8GVQ7_PSICU|nr:hypothetical protein JR316_0008301 [Psilocybe cubensis]KAH9479706.1 hypothetical protein JR316_0008301 [Psilocybe cubensis]
MDVSGLAFSWEIHSDFRNVFTTQKSTQCHDPADDNRIFAEFSVSATLTTSSPRAEPQLIVMPIGHTLLDDIVISVLLLERQRLTAALDPLSEVQSGKRKAPSPHRIMES